MYRTFNKFGIMLATVCALSFVAKAADLPTKDEFPPIPTPENEPYVPSTGHSTWDGFYVGALVGYEALTSKFNISGNSAKPAGAHLGLFGGYNATFSDIIYGAELDAIYSFTSKSTVAGEKVTAPLGGSLRARIGMEYSQEGMAYITGGLGLRTFKYSSTLGNSSKTYLGYVVGLGSDYRVYDNVFVRGQYLYGGFGSKSHTVAGTNIGKVNLSAHMFSLGVGYQF